MTFCTIPEPYESEVKAPTPVVYALVEEQRELMGEPYIAYGIKLVPSDNNFAMYGLPSLAIADITTDRQKAEAFVALCNSLALRPEHLADAVADFIEA